MITQAEFPTGIGAASSDDNMALRRMMFKIAMPVNSNDENLKSLDGLKSSISNTVSTFETAAIQIMTGAKSDGNLAGHPDSLETVAGLTLPLPNSITDTQNHKWELQEGLVSKVVGAGTKAINNLIPGQLDISAEYAFAYATNNINRRQYTANPGYWQMYRGSEPRGFTFSWELVPSSQEESAAIRDIVLAFKKYSSPETNANNLMFKSPYIWTIGVANSYVSKMLALDSDDCVCTSVQVTYGDGNMTMFGDGMPKKISLTVSFQECTVITADKYNSSGTNVSSLAGSLVDTAINTAKAAFTHFFD